MAKESFLVYKSFYEPIKGLSDKQLGKLFRSLFEFQIIGNELVEDDIKMAFSFFKNQMELDEKKYQTVIERNRHNGANGGRPKNSEKETQTNPKNPVGFKEPKKPYNENVNVNDNVLNTDCGENATAPAKIDSLKSFKRFTAEDLKTELKPHKERYGVEMLKAFYEYWTEPAAKQGKLRFHLQDAWDTSRRLVTWANKDYNMQQKMPPKTGLNNQFSKTADVNAAPLKTVDYVQN